MLTCGIFYCRDSAEINDCGSLQTSSWLDSDMLRNRQQKHTANPLVAILPEPTDNKEHYDKYAKFVCYYSTHWTI